MVGIFWLLGGGGREGDCFNKRADPSKNPGLMTLSWDDLIEIDIN